MLRGWGFGVNRPADRRATFARARPVSGIGGWIGGPPPGATRANVGRPVAGRARACRPDRTGETNSVGDCGCSRGRRLAIPPGKYLRRPSRPALSRSRPAHAAHVSPCRVLSAGLAHWATRVSPPHGATTRIAPCLNRANLEPPARTNQARAVGSGAAANWPHAPRGGMGGCARLVSSAILTPVGCRTSRTGSTGCARFALPKRTNRAHRSTGFARSWLVRRHPERLTMRLLPARIPAARNQPARLVRAACGAR